MDGCLQMIMMALMHGLSTSPMQGFSLLVLVLMNSVLVMGDIEQVLDVEGIITMVMLIIFYDYTYVYKLQVIIFYSLYVLLNTTFFFFCTLAWVL